MVENIEYLLKINILQVQDRSKISSRLVQDSKPVIAIG